MDLDVSRLLVAWRGGDAQALDQLMEALYPQLKQIAGRHLRAEAPGRTLQPTALVNEAYLRLIGSEVDWKDRVHFLSVAARVMRRILIDEARSRARQKRGSGAQKVSLEEVAQFAHDPHPDLLVLEDALNRLAAFDERKARIIEMLFFGGLTYAETAAALDIGESTLHRELVLARACLNQALRSGAAE